MHGGGSDALVLGQIEGAVVLRDLASFGIFRVKDPYLGIADMGHC